VKREFQVIGCPHRYGFNAGLAAPGNLSKGYDSLSQDFATICWRLKQLGFNAVRLPFSFKHFSVSCKFREIMMASYAQITTVLLVLAIFRELCIRAWCGHDMEFRLVLLEFTAGHANGLMSPFGELVTVPLLATSVSCCAT
jgi:hypothetical protein